MVIIAIALAITFVIASPLNTAADALYSKYRVRLQTFETETRHPDDQPIDPGHATIAVFGMGRLGTMAFDFLHKKYGDTVVGFDYNADKVKSHQDAGRNVHLPGNDPILQPSHRYRCLLLFAPAYLRNSLCVALPHRR